jgi:hypothetical protein
VAARSVIPRRPPDGAEPRVEGLLVSALVPERLHLALGKPGAERRSGSAAALVVHHGCLAVAIKPRTVQDQRFVGPVRHALLEMRQFHHCVADARILREAAQELLILHTSVDELARVATRPREPKPRVGVPRIDRNGLAKRRAGLRQATRPDVPHPVREVLPGRRDIPFRPTWLRPEA